MEFKLPKKNTAEGRLSPAIQGYSRHPHFPLSSDVYKGLNMPISEDKNQEVPSWWETRTSRYRK